MSSKERSPKSNQVFEFPFHSVRHISCPEDLDNDRRIYTGHTPISSILKLSTDENVRAYLLDAEGKKKPRQTQVNKAIWDTLENYSHNFSVLNSGVVIVSRGCEIDEKHKKLILRRASIVNGSQTQGIIKDFIEQYGPNFDSDFPATHVKYEVIVTSNEDLIAQISIARNYQNDVLSISIAGRLGQLDELEKSFAERRPGAKLQKSETQLSEDYVRTERLLQVITALIPEVLWPRVGDVNKVYTYSRKAQCLKEFQEAYNKSHDKSDPDQSKFKKLYKFYLDIVSEADELYNKWKQHQGFQGTKLRAIKRDDQGRILEVPDGIVFPILASLSMFAKQTRNGWCIVYPKSFSEDELIAAAKTAYMQIADSNPNTMGKSKACYSTLLQITSIYKKVQNDIDLKRART